jgi:hypothetical protein
MDATNAVIFGILAMQALGSMRSDEIVARQGVCDNQRSAQLCTNSFIESSHELSIPEAMATSALALSMAGTQAASMNLGSVTPPIALQVKPAA